MKRFFLLGVSLVLLFLLLVGCEQVSVTSATLNDQGELVLTYEDGTTKVLDSVKVITDAKVNEDGHLIVTYSDGTTEDRGYQTIPAYTVTFVDHDGTVLSSAKTYRGLGVTAPADPVRADHVFTGWDKTFDAITADTTVTATYAPLPTYTVTFIDYDGTVLKTETVVVGRDATPPANPTRSGYNFTGWSGDYTGVIQNVEIRAEYVEKGYYTVKFVDYNGLPLGTVSVKEGERATAPVTPTRDGYTFKGWSSSLSNVMASKTVTAEYTLISAANVFDLAYRISGDTVTLTLSLAGEVCLAGFEGTLTFEGMTATAVEDNSANVIANLKADGTVSAAYTSATNVTKGEKLLTVTLTKAQGAQNATATLTLKDCFNQNFEEVSYKVIGQSITLGS